MIPTDIPFNRSRFDRARSVATGPSETAIFSAPEDVILMKLRYYAQGRSDKHLRDIAGVLRVSKASIDLDYIQKWAPQLGVAELWKEVLARAQTTDP